MYSLVFGDTDTYNDWHLVPDSRPIVSMPDPKPMMVEIPGGQGGLDLSESLTGYPLYGMRSGEWLFHVLNGYESWLSIYQKISHKLHNREANVKLSEDPDWYYRGRYTVSWTSNNDGTWSDVTIGYTLDPFRLYKNNVTITKTISSNTQETPVLESLVSYPIIPVVTISSNTTDGLVFYVVNEELGTGKTETVMKPISGTGTRTLYSCVLSNMTGSSNNCKIVAERTSGSAEYTIKYRRAIL